MEDPLLSIGETARRAGVSVQTLRHYHAIGLLPPSRITAAGYRRYDARDRVRLELIRTLRRLDFGLDAIRELLAGHDDIRAAAALQLGLLEAQTATLQRRTTLLRAALRGDEGALLPRLVRLDALAGLDRFERETFLARHLGDERERPWGDPEVWRLAVLDLPEAMDEAQLEAWLELAELAADPAFRAALERQRRPFAGVDAERMRTFGDAVRGLMDDAAAAAEAERPADGPEAQRRVAAWIGATAAALDRAPDAAFERELLERVESGADPRFERYWRLVAVLKGWPADPAPARASAWLLAALRQRVGMHAEEVGAKRSTPSPGRR